MKKILIFSLVAIIAIVSLATGSLFCGKANAEPVEKTFISKTFPVEDFVGLEVSVPAEVRYETGEAYCHIEGQENIIKDLNVEVNNGRLEIYSDRKLKNIKKLDIVLKSSSLEYLNINGAGGFECERGFETSSFKAVCNGAADIEINNLTAEDVNIKINGAGDIEIDNLDTQKADVQINGAGDVSLSGRAKDVTATINGAGEIDVKELKYENISASTNGIGRIER